MLFIIYKFIIRKFTPHNLLVQFMGITIMLFMLKCDPISEKIFQAKFSPRRFVSSAPQLRLQNSVIIQKYVSVRTVGPQTPLLFTNCKTVYTATLIEDCFTLYKLYWLYTNCVTVRLCELKTDTF